MTINQRMFAFDSNIINNKIVFFFFFSWNERRRKCLFLCFWVFSATTCYHLIACCWDTAVGYNLNATRYMPHSYFSANVWRTKRKQKWNLSLEIGPWLHWVDLFGDTFFLYQFGTNRLTHSKWAESTLTAVRVTAIRLCGCWHLYGRISGRWTWYRVKKSWQHTNDENLEKI